MDASFFTAGGTLDATAPSYVAREADSELFEALLAGEYCYVLTPRQTGKSSLMVRTISRLRRMGRKACALDLTASGQNVTPEQWYTGLLDSLGRQLGCEDHLEEYWEAHSSLGPVQRWINALADCILPDCGDGLVLFIDEIDFVRSLPFPTDEFFAAVRECHNRRATDPRFLRLTFCLLGVVTPSDLIRDPHATPFNIGRHLDLTDFSEMEAEVLATGLETLGTGNVRPGPYGKALLRRILFWTGGHPYLTQRLCRALQEQAEHGRSSRSESVDILVRSLFLSPATQRQDINILTVRDRLTAEDSPGDSAGLLELYERVLTGAKVPDDRTNRLVATLRLSGAVVPMNGCLRVRNRIYAALFDRRWVRRHMPDAELQRQQRAVRRALFRAATVSAVLIGSLGGLMGLAMRNESRARELAKRLGVAKQTQEVTLGKLQTALTVAEEKRALARREAEAAKRARSAATVASNERERQRLIAVQRAREANLARADAQGQAHLARRHSNALQLSLSRLQVSEGWRLAEQGDVIAALLRFNEARRLEGVRPARQRIHRLRQALSLAAAPRLSQIWPTGSSILAAAYNPDGERIATLNEGGWARVWSAHGAPLSPSRSIIISKGDFSGHVAFAADSTTPIITSVAGAAASWTALNGWELTVPKATPGVWVVPSPDQSRFATLDQQGFIHLRRSGPGQNLIARLAVGEVEGRPLFSRDGKKLLTRHTDGAARLWSTHDGRLLVPALRHSGKIACAAFSRDGERIATGGQDFSARVWSSITGKALSPPLNHHGTVVDVDFSPNGDRVATAAQDGQARVWAATTGAGVTPYLQHSLAVVAVRFSPDGSRVLTGGGDGVARVWDSTTGRITGSILPSGGPLSAVEFHPGGSRVLTAGSDGLVREWDLAPSLAFRRVSSGSSRWTLPLPLMAGPAAPTSTPLEARFDRPALFMLGRGDHCYVQQPDGRAGAILQQRGVVRGDVSGNGLVVTLGCAGGYARTFDARTGAPISPRMRHSLAVHLVRLSPNGKWLASSSLDGTTRVWDTLTGVPRTPPIFQSQTILHSAISPDGSLLATMTESNVRLWDAGTGEAVSPPVPFRTQHAVLGMEFDSGSSELRLETTDERSVLKLAPLRLPEERFRLLTTFLACRRLDGSGGLEPLPSRSLGTVWTKIRPDYNELCPADETRLLAWHTNEAAESERTRQWTTALVHLGHLIRANPRQGSLLERRGRVSAELGDWTSAARDFSRALSLVGRDAPAESHLTAYRLALCQLASDDVSGFNETCHYLLNFARHKNSERITDLAVWTCALSSKSPTQAALELATLLTRRQPENLSFKQTRAALLLRCGRTREAYTLLRELIDQRGNGGETLDQLFRALTCRRLGRSEEEADALARVDADLEALKSSPVAMERTNWATVLELNLLRAEAKIKDPVGR